MIKTHGLTHIALAVRDAQRSSRFYQQAFGMVETYRGDGWAQVETPGCHDVIVLTEGEPHAGKPGGIQHFGFRLTDPADIVTWPSGTESSIDILGYRSLTARGSLSSLVAA